MTLRYGYFDSEITGVDSEGMPIFDRAENSELFRLLFAKLISNGVLASPGDCFQVLAGDGFNVKVRPGFGLINGAFAYDNAEAVYQLVTAPTQYSRIDRVILRANYAERLCEILIRAGTPASAPVPPDITQPASGDYYELCLAEITITANATVITQSSIKDTRPNSSLCGYITQLIDHIETSAFYEQFDAFYKEFVKKSDASYEEFLAKAEQSFNIYTDAINEYITNLQAKGNADTAAVIESLTEFMRTSKNEFNQWFAEIKDQLSEDVAGELQNEITEHEDRLSLLEKMVIQNEITAPIDLNESDGQPELLCDDDGVAILADWKYKYQ